MYIIENAKLEQASGGCNQYDICYTTYEKVMDTRGGFVDIFAIIFLTPFGLAGKYWGELEVLQIVCGKDFNQAKNQYCASHPNSEACIKK